MWSAAMDGRVFDLEATGKDLGYVPQDDAEDYFRRVEG